MHFTSRLFVSCGDPHSINFEILAKSTEQHQDKCIVVVGSHSLWSQQCQSLGMTLQHQTKIVHEDHLPEAAGLYFLDIFSQDHFNIKDFQSLDKQTQKLCGQIAMASLAKAAELSAQYKCPLVTLPVNKFHCSLYQHGFKGQTDWLAERFDQNTIMILKNPELTVALCTNHIPISKVATAITKNLIRTKALLLHGFLKSQGIQQPKIGVCGLNPHCGDQGVIGNEDHDIQTWVQAIHSEENIALMGPVAADTLFQKSFRDQCDGVLAMYHDQGLIPVKALSKNKRCVNITWGLDFLRISPDHGPAEDLYLKGLADTGSLDYALEVIPHATLETNRQQLPSSQQAPMMENQLNG